MTNRFGRVIDRIRLVAQTARTSNDKQSPRFVSQLAMLQRRANLLRASIILAVFSVLMAALLVITLFITAATHSDLGLPIVILFLGSMLLLIGSLIAFMGDLNLSLEAVKLEIES